MQLSIYSISKVLYRGDAKSVNCPTSSGEITILDGHEPLISILKQGVLKIIDAEKKEHYIPVSSGLLELRAGNEVKFLIEE